LQFLNVGNTEQISIVNPAKQEADSSPNSRKDMWDHQLSYLTLVLANSSVKNRTCIEEWDAHPAEHIMEDPKYSAH
jgi:hypothetical protein